MAPFCSRIGSALRPSTSFGLEFISTMYSRSPILAVPAGRIRFCAAIALETSLAERCLAYIATGSRSTMMFGLWPP